MLTVCNYHYIREDFKTKYPSIFGVTPLAFKEQLLLLRNQGDFISSRDLINSSDTILSSEENYILITFDDGLKEQCDFGLSILNTLNIPALFFANSINYLEKKGIETRPIISGNFANQPAVKLYKLNKSNEKFKNAG